MFWFIWCSSVITILSRCSMALTNLSDQCGDVSLRSVRCGLCLGVNRELFILILSEHNGCFEFHGRQPAQPKEKLLDQCKLLRDFTRMKLYIHRQLMCAHHLNLDMPTIIISVSLTSPNCSINPRILIKFITYGASRNLLLL